MQVAIFFVLMLLFGSGATRIHAEPAVRTKQAQATDQILIASLRYCFGSWDSKKQDRSYLCSINPRLESGPFVDQYLKAKHIERIAAENEPSTDHHPKQWVYVNLESVTKLDDRREKTTAYLSCDFNCEVFTEAKATIYLDRIHGRWIVNRHESRIEVGE